METGAVKRRDEVISTSSGIETGPQMEKPNTGDPACMQAAKTGKKKLRVPGEDFYDADT